MSGDIPAVDVQVVTPWLFPLLPLVDVYETSSAGWEQTKVTLYVSTGSTCSFNMTFAVPLIRAPEGKNSASVSL